MPPPAGGGTGELRVSAPGSSGATNGKPHSAAELSCFVHAVSKVAAELPKFPAESTSPRAESTRFAAPASFPAGPSTSPAAPAGKFLHASTSPGAESTSPAAEPSSLWTVSRFARLLCLIFGHGGLGPTPRRVGWALRRAFWVRTARILAIGQFVLERPAGASDGAVVELSIREARAVLRQNNRRA